MVNYRTGAPSQSKSSGQTKESLGRTVTQTQYRQINKDSWVELVVTSRHLDIKKSISVQVGETVNMFYIWQDMHQLLLSLWRLFAFWCLFALRFLYLHCGNCLHSLSQMWNVQDLEIWRGGWKGLLAIRVAQEMTITHWPACHTYTNTYENTYTNTYTNACTNAYTNAYTHTY